MTRLVSNRPWTPEEESLLRSMREAGKSTTLISAKLKRTVISIKWRASKIGVSFKQKKAGPKARAD
jgi:hypothetical protein